MLLWHHNITTTAVGRVGHAPTEYIPVPSATSSTHMARRAARGRRLPSSSALVVRIIWLLTPIEEGDTLGECDYYTPGHRCCVDVPELGNDTTPFGMPLPA